MEYKSVTVKPKYNRDQIVETKAGAIGRIKLTSITASYDTVGNVIVVTTYNLGADFYVSENDIVKVIGG